ncbi:MAG: AraC family transcriptional regulator [Phaeodactylibacter sp.]|nr:AraC family transcriptional regulator [Phaeodactylibacter sp.]
MDRIVNIDNIGLLNEFLSQEKPKHPLISVVDFSKVDFSKQKRYLEDTRFSTSFYSILLKKLNTGSVKYGRAYYDFQEGCLFFMSPNQVFNLETSECVFGWGLYFHPDLIRRTALANSISRYTFFNYNVNEALHLSEDEKGALANVISGIKTELNRPIDNHSKPVIVSGIELLLNHCMRFYERQFITRTEANQSVMTVLETFLRSYFQSDLPQKNGLPTVAQCAEKVNLSNNYLSDLLKKETGKSTQEHIHFFLIEEAKTRLLNSPGKSISEIAYELGFDYPQYFGKLFKKKVGTTPLEFRNVN